MLPHYAPGSLFSRAAAALDCIERRRSKCVVRHLARPNRLRNPRPGYHDRRDVAFSHSLNRMHGTKTDGAKADLWFRQTFGFQRIKGEWKIAHEHESVPFYMDGSFKAAIDLSRSWAASLEQMNKGETGQSNGEKQRARRKSSRLLTPQQRAAACVRSVLEDQAKL